MNSNFLDVTKHITQREAFHAGLKQASAELLAKAIKTIVEMENKNAEQAFILLQQEQIKELVDTLQSLYDLQNGSPLPSYDEDYEKAMNESSRVLGYWQKFYSGE